MVRPTQDAAAERHWACARRLKERRLALGLTQAEVVARIDNAAGLTNRSVSVWESGRGLDIAWLPELADALDCTVTYLLGRTDDPRSWQPDEQTPPTAAAGPATTAAAGPATTAAAGPATTAAASPAETATAGSTRTASANRPSHHNWILGPQPVVPDTAVGPPSSGSRRHVDQ